MLDLNLVRGYRHKRRCHHYMQQCLLQSYLSVSPPLSDGLTRVEEHRRMVAALHRKGLRVVADVVFNHVLPMGLGSSTMCPELAVFPKLAETLSVSMVARLCSVCKCVCVHEI